jgi:hypothetical protein
LRERVLALLDEFPRIGLILVEVNQGHDTWEGDPPRHAGEGEAGVAGRAEVRARGGVLGHYQRGRVLHARRLPELEQQMCTFPKGPFDDMVDAVGRRSGFIPVAKKAAPSASKTAPYAVTRTLRRCRQRYAAR